MRRKPFFTEKPTLVDGTMGDEHAGEGPDAFAVGLPRRAGSGASVPRDLLKVGAAVVDSEAGVVVRGPRPGRFVSCVLSGEESRSRLGGTVATITAVSWLAR